MRENPANTRASTTTPSTSEQLFQADICRTVTRGRRGGVGTPLTFAPLSDLFARTTHYLRSDDAHAETSTFVPIDLFEEVLESIQQCAGLDDAAGWWCLDQSSGAWFGTGIRRFSEQFRIPHDEQPHLTSTHHHGTAVWIAPVDRSLSGVEAIVVAGDPAKNPGEGKTLGESVRRPTVTLLLSSERPAGLSTACRTIEMPFFTEPGNLASNAVGSAGEWTPDCVTFDFRPIEADHTVSAQYLGMHDGPQGPDLEVTNPYYTDYTQAMFDLDRVDSVNESTAQNLVHRLASYERIGAHCTTRSDELRNLGPGDLLAVERIELTYLSGCGMTFSPANADVRVKRFRD